MSNLYFVKKDNFSSCCNLVLWDFIFTILCISILCPNWIPVSLTGFQQFLIGLAGAFLLMCLMLVPYLKYIILILFSMFWGALAYELLDEIFHISNYTASWRYGIGIICFIFAFCIHIGSAEDLNILSLNTDFNKKRDQNFDEETSYPNIDTSTSSAIVFEDCKQCEEQFTKSMLLAGEVQAIPSNDESSLLKNFVKLNTSKIVRQYNHLLRAINRYNKILTESAMNQLAQIVDDTLLMLDEYIDTLENMLADYKENISQNNSTYKESEQRTEEKTQNSPGNSNYFKGCDTLDKLNKRYRTLAKVYHTDSGNGDAEVFIEITEEYNRLKEQLS